MKAKLLVVELWGLGDLLIATPFLRAAVERFDVTLLAKPFAQDLHNRFWPLLQLHTFTAPWTAFTRKYHLVSWPWREIGGLRKLAAQRFDFGLSARWDPRDHCLLFALRATVRLGFPRLGSRLFLSRPLQRPNPIAHRYEAWRTMAEALGFQLPPRQQLPVVSISGRQHILIHTGAGQPVRVWPLACYQRLVARLRQHGYLVRVACDPDQLPWWTQAGEPDVVCPRTVTELLALVEQAALFIGNDSGPGHVAAACGVPTFTLFGPQLPEWFAPIHPAAEWMEGQPCPYKPCSDYCRFPVAHCLADSSEEQVWTQVKSFAERTLSDSHSLVGVIGA